MVKQPGYIIRQLKSEVLFCFRIDYRETVSRGSSGTRGEVTDRLNSILRVLELLCLGPDDCEQDFNVLG